MDLDSRVTVIEENSNQTISDLEAAIVDLDSRIKVLEEDGNQTISELEVRVDTLEETATDHETRISATESDVTGRLIVRFFLIVSTSDSFDNV